MVQRQLAFGATIHTLKIIALENILSRKVHSFVGRIHVSIEPYYRRHRKTPGDATQLVSVGTPHHFALVEVNQHEGPLHGAHHQRAEVLIKYKNSTIHGEKIASIN